MPLPRKQSKIEVLYSVHGLELGLDGPWMRLLNVPFSLQSWLVCASGLTDGQTFGSVILSDKMSPEGLRDPGWTQKRLSTDLVGTEAISCRCRRTIVKWDVHPGSPRAPPTKRTGRIRRDHIKSVSLQPFDRYRGLGHHGNCCVRERY
jgi:hypothetical protein